MKNQNSPNYLLAVVTVVCLGLLFVGCKSQDSFTRHHHVGNVYEVVGNLCVIGDMLKDEVMTDLAGWQAHGEKFNKRFEKLPLGTKIKIVSIEKQTRSSWNTGRYSYYVVLVNVLATGHDGVRYEASHLMYGEHGEKFGDNGGKLVTLKLVSDGKK